MNIMINAREPFLANDQIHEGDNGYLWVAVNELGAVAVTLYLWLVYKLPSGRTVISDQTVLSNVTEDATEVVALPDCLLTESGRLKVQAVLTESNKNLLEIVDDYSAGTFTDILMKSPVYEFYIRSSLDPMGELVPQPGSLSDAAKEYIEDLVDEIIAQGAGIDLSSKADKNNTVLAGSLSMGRRTGSTVGSNSSAVGNSVSAQGVASHAEGYNNDVLSNSAHAEGNGNTVAGVSAHAEGSENIVNGNSSHAEGYGNRISSYASAAHAEGSDNAVSGVGAHVEGNGNKASSAYQHVEGKFNVEDTNNEYAHIVGNGAADNDRSNAHTLDWDGNAWFAGDVKVGGSNDSDPYAVPLGKLREIEVYSASLTLAQASSNTTVYDSSGGSITNYKDESNPQAEQSFINIIPRQSFLLLKYGNRKYRLDIFPLTTTGSPPTVVGYYLTYNAVRMDVTSFKKINDAEPIFVFYVAVSTGNVVFTSSVSGSVNIALSHYGTPAMLEEIPNSIQVDAALDATSQHPVENRAVKSALDQKVNKTDVESALSRSSQNPVKNSVIKAALDLKGDLRTVTFYESSVDLETAATNTYLSDSSGNAITNYCDTQLPPMSQYLVDAIQEERTLYLNFANRSEVIGITEKYDTSDPTLIVGYYLRYNADVNTLDSRSVRWKKHLNNEPIVVIEISVTDLSVVSIYTSLDSLDDISITGYGTPAMLEELDEIVVTGNIPYDSDAEGGFDEVRNLNYTAKEIWEAYHAGKKVRGVFSFGLPFLGPLPVEFSLEYVSLSSEDVTPPVYHYSVSFIGGGIAFGSAFNEIKVSEIQFSDNNTTGSVKSAVVPKEARLLPILSGDSDYGKIAYVTDDLSGDIYWGAGSVEDVIGSYVTSQIKEYVSVYDTSVELVRSAADDYLFDSSGGTINNYSDDTLTDATSWLIDYTRQRAASYRAKALSLFINGNEYLLGVRTKTDGWYLSYNALYRSSGPVWRKRDDELPIFVIEITESTNKVTIASSEEITGTFTIKVYGGTHSYKEEFDTTPTLNSLNAVTSDGIKRQFNSVDTALNNKQQKLISGQNLDNYPIENSTHPITSGSVWKELYQTGGDFSPGVGITAIHRVTYCIGKIMHIDITLEASSGGIGTSERNIGSISKNPPASIQDIVCPCVTCPDANRTAYHPAYVRFHKNGTSVQVYLTATEGTDRYIQIHAFYSV